MAITDTRMNNIIIRTARETDHLIIFIDNKEMNKEYSTEDMIEAFFPTAYNDSKTDHKKGIKILDSLKPIINLNGQDVNYIELKIISHSEGKGALRPVGVRFIKDGFTYDILLEIGKKDKNDKFQNQDVLGQSILNNLFGLGIIKVTEKKGEYNFIGEFDETSLFDKSFTISDQEELDKLKKLKGELSSGSIFKQLYDLKEKEETAELERLNKLKSDKEKILVEFIDKKATLYANMISEMRDHVNSLDFIFENISRRALIAATKVGEEGYKLKVTHVSSEGGGLNSVYGKLETNPRFTKFPNKVLVIKRDEMELVYSKKNNDNENVEERLDESVLGSMYFEALELMNDKIKDIKTYTFKALRKFNKEYESVQREIYSVEQDKTTDDDIVEVVFKESLEKNYEVLDNEIQILHSSLKVLNELNNKVKNLDFVFKGQSSLNKKISGLFNNIKVLTEEKCASGERDDLICKLINGINKIEKLQSQIECELNEKLGKIQDVIQMVIDTREFINEKYESLEDLLLALEKDKKKCQILKCLEHINEEYLPVLKRSILVSGFTLCKYKEMKNEEYHEELSSLKVKLENLENIKNESITDEKPILFKKLK